MQSKHCDYLSVWNTSTSEEVRVDTQIDRLKMVAKKSTNSSRSSKATCDGREVKKMNVKVKKVNKNIRDVLIKQGCIKMSQLTLLERNPGLLVERIWDLTDNNNKMVSDFGPKKSSTHISRPSCEKQINQHGVPSAEVKSSEAKSTEPKSAEESDTDTIIVSDLDPTDITSNDESPTTPSRQYNRAASNDDSSPAPSPPRTRAASRATANPAGSSTEEYSDASAADNDIVIIEDTSSTRTVKEGKVKAGSGSAGNT